MYNKSTADHKPTKLRNRAITLGSFYLRSLIEVITVLVSHFFFHFSK